MDVQRNQLLQIGTVVYAHKGTTPLVILARGQLLPPKEEEGEGALPKFYEYVGGIYPQGYNNKELYYFNHEDIEKISFEVTLDDEANQRYLEVLSEWLKANVSEFERTSKETIADKFEVKHGEK